MKDISYSWEIILRYLLKAASLWFCLDLWQILPCLIDIYYMSKLICHQFRGFLTICFRKHLMKYVLRTCVLMNFKSIDSAIFLMYKLLWLSDHLIQLWKTDFYLFSCTIDDEIIKNRIFIMDNRLTEIILLIWIFTI